MSIDPADYDVPGLRELALRGRRRSGEWPRVVEPREALGVEEFAEVDRRSAWLGSHDERHKPYLRRIPERSDLRRVLRGWLERLVDRAGPRGAADALSHYERLGWMTESVAAELRATLPEPDHGGRGSIEDLARGDHVHGLSVVALAGLGAEGERLAEACSADTDLGSSSRRE